MKKIIIVGGGSAGWMTASTLIKQFPMWDITLIESPNIPTVGVGESTLGSINQWLQFLGIKDKDFMPACDATYKTSIKFTDFYKKGEHFHYPFGQPDLQGTRNGLNDWWLKKFFYENSPYSDYAETYYPLGYLAENNKILKSNELMNFNFENDVAYQFDATKFGIWLRDNYALPRGVKHIKEEITDIQVNQEGIISVNNYTADLYFDCTGFKSLLMEKLEVPFNSYEEMLVNNSAWATHLPYTNIKEELTSYTNCTAIENGWVWNIPLTSRMGTGYVYSDKFVDDETALNEFKKYLGRDDLNFKKIKFTPGIRDRIWEKNVISIGLSAGFIEPLESNGLMTVHEFLLYFMRNTQRETITQWDKDNFNSMCKSFFDNFAQFVAFHFAITSRTDTSYWKYCTNKKWNIAENAKMQRTENYYFSENSGYHCIAAGGHWGPTEACTLNYFNSKKDNELLEDWKPFFNNLEKRIDSWKTIAKNLDSPYDFLNKEIYNGKI